MTFTVTPRNAETPVGVLLYYKVGSLKFHFQFHLPPIYNVSTGWKGFPTFFGAIR